MCSTQRKSFKIQTSSITKPRALSNWNVVKREAVYGKMRNFGYEQGKGFGKWAAYPHPTFLGVIPPRL